MDSSPHILVVDDDRRCRDMGGVALGRAVARAVIGEHGGDITLSDRHEGGLRCRETTSGSPRLNDHMSQQGKIVAAVPS